MNVTREQYEAALLIVQAYEESLRYDEQSEEDDFDERDWEEEEAEAEEERRMETAANCTCGAWIVNKEGTVLHVADCYCGAE